MFVLNCAVQIWVYVTIILCILTSQQWSGIYTTQYKDVSGIVCTSSHLMFASFDCVNQQTSKRNSIKCLSFIICTASDDTEWQDTEANCKYAGQVHLKGHNMIAASSDKSTFSTCVRVLVLMQSAAIEYIVKAFICRWSGWRSSSIVEVDGDHL